MRKPYFAINLTLIWQYFEVNSQKDHVEETIWKSLMHYGLFNAKSLMCFHPVLVGLNQTQRLNKSFIKTVSLIFSSYAPISKFLKYVGCMYIVVQIRNVLSEYISKLLLFTVVWLTSSVQMHIVCGCKVLSTTDLIC